MTTMILNREDRMMKRTLLFAALAAIALCACQKEPAPQEVPDAPGTGTGPVFTAITEGAATRTALSENGGAYDVVWRNGDRITIVDGAANAGVYSTTSTTTSAEFSFADEGMAATEPTYKAWYPASIYNAGTPTLPAIQDYIAGNISGFPMYAESGTTSLSFKNLCGIIRLNVSTTMSGKKVRRITLSAAQGMSGPVSNAATLVADSYVAAVSGTAGVTLDCGEGVGISSTPTAFYISVPANTYNSLTITVWTTDNLSQSRIAKGGITVTRSSITDVNLSFNGLAASSLVQQWPFDGNALNAIPSGVNATVNGATLTTDRFGNENSAYYFDGNDWMSAAGAANFGTSSFSANVWVCSTQSSGSGNILRTDNGYSSNGWLLRFNRGKIEIWEGRSAGYAYVSSSSYADGKWHMLTFVRDVENLRGKLYVDGSFVGEYTISGTVNNVSNTLTFGTYGNHDGEFYCGKMDDVRMFDKALSPAEITALYRSSATDLSALATANTYIVSGAGQYKFRATVKGNGGLDPITGSTATTINPADIAGVRVLWELSSQGRAIKHDGVSYDISYANGYVYFSTPDSFVSGDACVAVYDSSDNILWSWVIWATPQPGTTEYNGATFMDRNLGAIDVGNCMRGFLYEWGRKDAFSAANGGYDVYPYVPVASSVFTHSTGPATMAYAIAHPTDWVRGSSYTWMGDTECTAKPWRTDVKTIYDPCPAGWRIPVKEEISGITGLPNTGIGGGYDPNESYKGFGNPGTGYYWTTSSDDGKDERGYAFCNDGRNINHWGQDQGYAIRPVRE